MDSYHGGRSLTCEAFTSYVFTGPASYLLPSLVEEWPGNEATYCRTAGVVVWDVCHIFDGLAKYEVITQSGAIISLPYIDYGFQTRHRKGEMHEKSLAFQCLVAWVRWLLA